jgi:3-deoxy-D-manno-octulosonic-acid transferase
MYDIVFFLAALGYSPTFLKRWIESRSGAEGFSARLGIYPRSVEARLSERENVWIQAVSVGEVLCLKRFLGRFRETFPDEALAISTTTVTGQRLARQMIEEREEAFYFPLDLSWIVRRTAQVVQPKMFLMVETEIWPGLIRELANRRVPMAVINGRISDRSYQRYRLIQRWLRPVLSRIDTYLMQTEEDAGRIISLGAPRERVQVVGNLKFDNVLGKEEAESADPVRERLVEIWNGFPIWVAGSTHPGEEEPVLKVHARARKRVPNLKLVIAPRHVENVPRVVQALEKRHMTYARWSRARGGGKVDVDVMVLDTIGDLVWFYRSCDVAFMGGSLVLKGGQNPIEPAQFGRPVLFGGHVFNFQDVYDRLAEKKGAYLVDEHTLEEKLVELLTDRVLLEASGERAREMVRESQGSTEKTLQCLKEMRCVVT